MTTQPERVTPADLDALRARHPDIPQDTLDTDPYVHWAGEPGEGPTSLHGNGSASFSKTSGDEDEVTCSLCLTLLTRHHEETRP